jgi:hypothetical protein
LLGEAITSMAASFAAMGGEESEDEFSLYDEEELIADASKMGKGVKFSKGEKLSEKNREGYLAVYIFEDINDLVLDQNPSEVMPMGEAAENDESSGNKINFKFTKGIVSDLTVIMPEEKFSEKKEDDYETPAEGNDDPIDEEAIEQLKTFIKDFRITIQLIVDGDITETNATYVKENEITLLNMNLEKLMDSPEKLTELEKYNNISLSEAKELFKKIPGMKFELNEKINVQFK